MLWTIHTQSDAWICRVLIITVSYKEEEFDNWNESEEYSRVGQSLKKDEVTTV
jgi:hypothetical protein